MSNFVNLLGGLGAAYTGFQRGADAELERQQKAVRDETERRRLSDENTLAPQVAQAKQLQLQAQIDQAKADAEIAPIKRDTTKRLTQAEADMVDGKIKLAKGQQDAALDKQLYETISQAATGVKTMEAAQSDVMALAGKQLAAGNYNGLTQMMDHVIQSPIIPGWNSLGKPVKTELANPPAGVQDMTGQPAQPNALKITFADGSTQWLNSAPLAEAYRKQLATQYKPIISKPGEVARDPITGRELWKNDPLPPKGWIRNEQGDLEFIGGGVGGGAGTGAGKGGKAVDPLKPATDAWEIVATKSDAKLPPDVNARGHRITQQLVAENPNVPPTVAAEVALAVAQDPSKATPSVNLQTGRIDAVYNDKQLGEMVISRGIASAANPGDVTPEQMKTAVSKFLGAQDPKLRAELTAAAFDPAARQKLEANMFAEFDKSVEAQIASNPKQADAIRAQAEATKRASLASLNEKLALINKNIPAPKQKSDSAMPGVAGGLPKYTPQQTDPNSPAGRSQARQQQLRDEKAAREQQQSEQRTQLGAQFQRDKQTMQPLDLARKYDELRGQLPTKEAAELQQIERTIR